MAAAQTMGERLAQLRARTGLSMDEVAKGAGYARRSSVQRFFDPTYNPTYLPMDTALRLSQAFEGKGEPPVSVQELLTLAGVPEGRASEQFSLKDRIGHLGDLPRDIPIYGTALGGEVEFDQADGTGSIGVEQAELDQSEVLGYLRRPPALTGRKDVYGVYVAGSSMFPRFSDGEAVFVDPRRPPMIGDDVIVQLTSPDEHDGARVSAVLIKRLVKRSTTYLELAQFSPAISFRISAKNVKSVHRIIPAAELLS